MGAVTLGSLKKRSRNSQILGRVDMTVGLGKLALDFKRRRVFYGREELRLSRKAFDLLEILVSNRERAVSKAELQDRLWPDTFVVEASLSNLVSEIRRATRDDRRRPRFVRTIHGFGYAFCGEVPDQQEAESETRDAPVYCWLSCENQMVPLREGEHLIGRSRQSVLLIDDRTVSRRHARIVVARGSVTLCDLNSKHGTYVAGKRIAYARALRDGDQVKVGPVEVTVRIPRWQQDPTDNLGL